MTRLLADLVGELKIPNPQVAGSSPAGRALPSRKPLQLAVWWCRPPRCTPKRPFFHTARQRLSNDNPPWAAQRSDRCPKESFGVRSKTFMPEMRKTWWHGLTPARGTLRGCGCYSKDYLSRVPTRSTSCRASESAEASAGGVSRARQAAGDDLPGGVAAAGRPLRGEPLFRCTRTGAVPSPPVPYSLQHTRWEWLRAVRVLATIRFL